MKKTIIALVALLIGLALGYGIASFRKQKQIDTLQLSITQERTDHMLKLGDAYHRQDQDDVLLLIEAPISFEATLHHKTKNRVRDAYFERNGMIERIKAYIAKHPDTRLKEEMLGEQDN